MRAVRADRLTAIPTPRQREAMRLVVDAGGALPEHKMPRRLASAARMCRRRWWLLLADSRRTALDPLILMVTVGGRNALAREGGGT